MPSSANNETIAILTVKLKYLRDEFEHYISDWKYWGGSSEGFNDITTLPEEVQREFKGFYREGSEIAYYVFQTIRDFTWGEQHYVKYFVDTINESWLSNFETYYISVNKVNLINNNLTYPVYAVKKMAWMYECQIELLYKVKNIVDILKDTDTYKWESGHSQQNLAISDYDKILRTIHTTGQMFQKYPNTYKKFGEEELRDVIVNNLQSNVSGSITGESFNNQGKTDILVREGVKNIFIGECKFWNGKEAYLSAIAQLNKYLTWEDSKVAIILFVRNKDFSEVLNKVYQYTEEHNLYVRDTGESDKNWYNFEFKKEGDSKLTVNIAVMLYHLPPNK